MLITNQRPLAQAQAGYASLEALGRTCHSYELLMITNQRPPAQAQAGYVSLEALLAHLSPSDDDMRAAHEAGQRSMADAIARIGIISLTSNEPVVRLELCICVFVYSCIPAFVYLCIPVFLHLCICVFLYFKLAVRLEAGVQGRQA